MNHNITFRKSIVTFLCVFSFSVCFGQATITYQISKPFTAGKAITPLSPDVKNINAVIYSINPALPDSLTIEPYTGKISGKPIKPAAEKIYIVTAKISKDSSIKSAPIKIEIASGGDKPSKANANSCKAANQKELNYGEWALVFLPAVLFILILIILICVINRNTAGQDKFILKDALSESGYTVMIKSNSLLTSKADELINLQKINTGATLSILTLFPPTINETDNKYRPSISRLIAFLTTLITLIIAVCLCSFFIYSYLEYGCEPDISKLSTVLISLGIGVAPYTVNKITGAFSSNKSTNTVTAPSGQ